MAEPTDRLELGSGLSLSFYDRDRAVSEEEFWKGVDAGSHCYFLLERGEEVVGAVPVSGAPSVWAVVSRKPLSLSPSVLCRPANIHGYIREGRWVPC